MPNNSEKFNTTEVQEILGYVPRWIIRWGITLLFLVLLVLLFGSWVIRYPDTVTGAITLTTENPPAALMARNTGKIENLFVKDNQVVAEGEVLACIENPADIHDIIKLESLLDTFNIDNVNIDLILANSLSAIKNLGAVEPNFATFIKLLSDYSHFRQIDYHRQKRNSISQQINKYELLISQLQRQKGILREELELSYNQLKRDSTLFVNDLIAENDLEESRSNYLSKQYNYSTAETNFENTNLSLLQQKQQLMETTTDFKDAESNLINAIRKAKNDLISALMLWKQEYLLISPIAGKVTFTDIWSKNQNVALGEIVMTVIPTNVGEIIGKIKLPVVGAGKVKIDQAVNIKLDNYPFMEYGMLKGKIKMISLVSSENYYIVNVGIPNNLTTNYNIELQFTQDMRGLAEIITEDRRLLERIIKPIQSIFKNRIAR